MQVFIRIKGSKGNLPKMQLTKKAGSAKNKKPLPYKFNRGTTHIFKLQGKDIGEVHSLIIEVCGLQSEWCDIPFAKLYCNDYHILLSLMGS